MKTPLLLAIDELYWAEPKRRPLPNYLEKVHKDVSAYMRGVLVDWLVKVAEEYKLCSETLYAEEYKLCSETLYLSISYIDRYLSLNTIARKRLQLLGVKQLSVGVDDTTHRK
ncbi:hypothetical protein CsatB_000890 [Cannabis sativa]